MISTITLLTVGVSWSSFRFRGLRLITEGEPIVLVKDGKLVERNLKRERLTRGDVEEGARLQQVASLEDIRWALLEKDGSITVIKKS